MPRAQLRVIAVAAFVLGLFGPPGISQVLTGIDGSAASLRWEMSPQTESKFVVVCARNPVSHQTTRGVSRGLDMPFVVPPGDVHCQRVAPVKQTFVLWTYDSARRAERSISRTMDLTKRAGQILTFVWIE